MRRIRHFFTALLLLCATTVVAHDFEVDGIYYNVTDEADKTVEVTYRGDYTYSYYDEYSGDVVIPEIVTYGNVTYSVTTIGGGAFRDCYELTSIKIPYSVISIGGGAFMECTNLASIENSNNLTSIGDLAFYSCFTLASIKIPNGVTTIGDYAFYSCTGLKGIAIPNSVTSIGYEAFYGCIGLTSITIPNSVTSLAQGVFASCSRLTSIEIPAGVTSIEGYVFYQCSGLTSIEIPNSVTSIGGWAFAYCRGLTSIEIPNSVTSIGDDAFSYCTGLTSIEIPNSVTSIGSSAFSYCSGLTSITSLIPAENLFVPGSSAFSGVDKAKCTLYVPKGAKETYATTDGWKDFENIVELDSVVLSVGQYGCATFCSPYALDFSEVEELKAYSAVGYNTDTQIVTLVRVMTTADGMGLFIKGEPGTYIVPVVETTGEHTLNLLVGTLESTNIDETTGAMTNYKLTIKSGDSEPKFYKFANSSTLNAGKAYLQLPTAWVPSEAQSSIGIRFDEGEATGVDEINGEQQGDCEAVYDLSGRRVENPSSGIYIIGGKKVIVK